MVLDLGPSQLSNGFGVSPPYQVSLFDVQTHSHFCGGAILNSLFILSAAHCWIRAARPFETPGKQYPLKKEDVRVIAGSRTLQFLEHSAQVRTIEEILSSSAYNATTHNQDFILLKLTTPLRMTRFVNYITLPMSQREFTGNISISGWGLVGSYPNGNHVMPVSSMSASLTILTQQECSQAYENVSVVTASMLCGKGNTVGVCKGDSGSPGVCWDEISGQEVLCGITSWSDSAFCNLNNDGTLISKLAPSVFVKVSSIITWISAVMRAVMTKGEYWMCDNLQIVRRVERCDKEREIHCEDESDELDCTHKITTTTTEQPVTYPRLESESTSTSAPNPDLLENLVI